jgi:hypothetical protein
VVFQCGCLGLISKHSCRVCDEHYLQWDMVFCDHLSFLLPIFVPPMPHADHCHRCVWQAQAGITFLLALNWRLKKLTLFLLNLQCHC